MIWLLCEKCGVCKDPQTMPAESPRPAVKTRKHVDPAVWAGLQAAADVMEADARANNQPFDRAAYLDLCVANLP